MINWFNMPDEGLSNGGLFEVKELDVTENGTYETKGEMYNKVTVNVEGGGGETWETVFDGNVTTEAQQIGEPTGQIEGVSEITADTIKVTFNGTEYTCEKVDDGYGDSTFTDYPFFIDSWQGSVLLHTQTAGTYTLKIEESQSGGSSDFSTAEVTNSGDSEAAIFLSSAINEIGPNMESLTEISLEAGRTKTAVLYKGHQYINITPSLVVTVSSGNAEIITVSDPMFGDMNFLDIKGDCTILVANAE